MTAKLKRGITKVKDPGSALTHFIAMILAIIAAIPLLSKAGHYSGHMRISALAIFILSMIGLYAASTIYHTLDISPKINKLLRKIDHMMIFVLIAGSYTPVCLINLRGKTGWTLLAFVWAFALGGIILKALWINAPRWLSTAVYVIMGWLVVFAFYPLEKAVPIGGIVLLAGGGIIYTLGAVIYAVKWPKLNFKMFGFHEIFHLFVMAGTAMHTVFMFAYVL